MCCWYSLFLGVGSIFVVSSVLLRVPKNESDFRCTRKLILLITSIYTVVQFCWILGVWDFQFDYGIWGCLDSLDFWICGSMDIWEPRSAFPRVVGAKKLLESLNCGKSICRDIRQLWVDCANDLRIWRRKLLLKTLLYLAWTGD